MLLGIPTTIDLMVFDGICSLFYIVLLKDFLDCKTTGAATTIL